MKCNNFVIYSSTLCWCGIQPNPSPLSVASSSGRSILSTGSNAIFSHLSLNHNLSFVQYTVQSIVNKLDIIQAVHCEIDIHSFTEKWLNPDISTEDIMLQSYSVPERKDRPGDPHGGVVIYVKNGIFYKRRNDLEIRGIESIWIELIHNRKKTLSLVSFIDRQTQVVSISPILRILLL